MADPNRQVHLNGFEKVEDNSKKVQSNDERLPSSSSTEQKAKNPSSMQQHPTAIIEAIQTESGQTKRVMKFPVVRFNSNNNNSNANNFDSINNNATTDNQASRNSSVAGGTAGASSSSRGPSVISQATTFQHDHQNDTAHNNNNNNTSSRTTGGMFSSSTTLLSNKFSMKFDPLRFRPRTEEAKNTAEEAKVAQKIRNGIHELARKIVSSAFAEYDTCVKIIQNLKDSDIVQNIPMWDGVLSRLLFGDIKTVPQLIDEVRGLFVDFGMNMDLPKEAQIAVVTNRYQNSSKHIHNQQQETKADERRTKYFIDCSIENDFELELHTTLIPKLAPTVRTQYEYKEISDQELYGLPPDDRSRVQNLAVKVDGEAVRLFWRRASFAARRRVRKLIVEIKEERKRQATSSYQHQTLVGLNSKQRETNNHNDQVQNLVKPTAGQIRQQQQQQQQQTGKKPSNKKGSRHSKVNVKIEDEDVKVKIEDDEDSWNDNDEDDDQTHRRSKDQKTNKRPAKKSNSMGGFAPITDLRTKNNVNTINHNRNQNHQSAASKMMNPQNFTQDVQSFHRQQQQNRQNTNNNRNNTNNTNNNNNMMIDNNGVDSLFEDPDALFGDAFGGPTNNNNHNQHQNGGFSPRNFQNKPSNNNSSSMFDNNNMMSRKNSGGSNTVAGGASSNANNNASHDVNNNNSLSATQNNKFTANSHALGNMFEFEMHSDPEADLMLANNDDNNNNNNDDNFFGGNPEDNLLAQFNENDSSNKNQNHQMTNNNNNNDDDFFGGGGGDMF